MMRAADLWGGDDFALRRRFDFSRGWGVSLQGLMRPRVVIIFEIKLKVKIGGRSFGGAFRKFFPKACLQHKHTGSLPLPLTAEVDVLSNHDRGMGCRAG